MCIWVAEENKEKIFQTFLFLKLLYRHGKTRLSAIEYNSISSMMGFNNSKTLQSHINKLIEIGWIKFNSKTKFYFLVSFDNLRVQYDWVSRVSIQCTLDDVNQLKGFVGAAIFSYQHKDFWRKVKREKSVLIKGRSYHFLSPSFNFKNEYAPVATTGIQALYNISKSKASDLKIAAEKADYILVKKDFNFLSIDADINLLHKYCDAPKNTVIKDGKVALQLIDLILPKIGLTRRRKLGT